MPRLVRPDADGPYKIEPQEKAVWVCGCGPSQKLPFCDGAHKACASEPGGKIVVYDDDRKSIIEERDEG